MAIDLDDPLPLARALIQRRSVTPEDDGALEVFAAALERLGFKTSAHRFGVVQNLYARRGDAGPNLCFAGHTDVVPTGEAGAWSVDPFGAEVAHGRLYGRGAADMKAALAAMVAAVARTPEVAGAVSFLITGDEEGPATDGTVKLLPAVIGAGERLDACIVGEPTSEDRVADVIKNGRRGSLNAALSARGRQGHVAYPAKADNPIPRLLEALAALNARALDAGAPGFQPSRLEVTTIDVGNAAHNVIPALASAKINIRFNTLHAGAELRRWVEETCAVHGVSADVRVTGEPFYTAPGALTALVAEAAAAVTGRAPALTTDGGTSDARFIKDHCPVVELGLRNATAHMVDEHIELADLETLTRIYAQVLERWGR